MKIDLTFYTQFEQWAAAKTKSLLASEVLAVPSFLAEVAAIVTLTVKSLETIPTKFPAVLGWALGSPDPLKPTRTAIRALQAKWGP